MRKSWLIPLVILVVLLGAWCFRWENNATLTQDSVVTKFKTDKWTGQQWINRSTPENRSENPVFYIQKTVEWDPELEAVAMRYGANPNSVSEADQAALRKYLEEKKEAEKIDQELEEKTVQAAWDKRNLFTRLWQYSVVVSGLWLFYTAWLGPWKKRREIQHT